METGITVAALMFLVAFAYANVGLGGGLRTRSFRDGSGGYLDGIVALGLR
jgi:hypothetical protein